VQARQAEEAERKNRKTFRDAAEGWNQLINRKTRAEKTRDRDGRMIGYLNKAFGNKPIDEVTPKDLIDLLETLRRTEAMKRGCVYSRPRSTSQASPKARLGSKRTRLRASPLAMRSPPRRTNSVRPFEAKPFGQLLRDVAAYSGRQGNIVGNALVFLALTFVRPGTVTQAEWDEFDLAAALWTIPFKKLKQRKFREGIDELRGKAHFVPLSRQAVVLLRNLKKQGGDGAYIFPGRKARPISTNALEVALKSLGYQDIHCPHGFRSSASTLLNAERITVDGNELPRFSQHSIEFQLEHVDKSTAAIYNRDQRLAERTKMMQFWADKIEKLREQQGDNLLWVPNLATV
jgi:integrase